jgi:multidrug efflux system membrane fusion protein
MRALFSYGLALVILLMAGLWLGTGTLVMGGNGPGEGERPIISVIEGEEHGPIATQLAEAGVLAEHEAAETVDPHLTIAQRNEEEMGSAETQLQSVRTTTYVAEPMQIEVPLRGRTAERASVAAVAETAGIIDTVHVQKGQQVRTGDLLCTLDQGTRAQAEAALKQAQLDVETNAGLRERGVVAANTGRTLEVALSSAQANVIAAQAGLDNANAELDRTEIRAKVDGVVQDPVATEGSMLAMGTPCATIVQLNPMKFIGSVPEARIDLARTGLDANVRTVTGKEAPGKVTFIASVADPATRSFAVEIEFNNEDGSIRGGVTAEAVVTMGSAPAQLLPQSVLTLNEEGVPGVRAVENDTVKFYPVQIVSDTRDGIWVMGLPASVDVITVGQEYVTEGQKVAATNVSAGGPAS